MSGRFAIVRPNIEPLAPEQFAKAFHNVPGLTPADAGMLYGENVGILVRNLPAEQAQPLYANLKADGVEAELVEERLLPVLPMSKITRQIEIKPEALIIFDVIGRKLPITWDRLQIIAAGSLQESTYTRTQTKSTQVNMKNVAISAATGIPLPMRSTTMAYTSQESFDWFLRLEILVTGDATRYTIEAENFIFTCLGDARTNEAASNFCLLVRELAGRATNAALSRGVVSIRSEPPEFTYYKRKNAFYDEITWMLMQKR